MRNQPVSETSRYLGNGMIRTTKKSPYGHGIGISSIQKAVEKYNGLVKMGIEKSIFKIEVILNM